MKKLALLSILIFALYACKRTQEEKAKLMNVDLAPPMANKAIAPNGSGKKAQDTSKKIIKEGEISFETGNLIEARKVIYNSLNKLGGYIAEENETNNGENSRKEYSIKARVPSKHFDELLNGVSSVADKIDSKNIRIKDVTTQYIDFTAQLANKKKLEERYQELLKKGNKISDLLEIENKLSEIRTDIETTQGQLNYLVKQVEFSSLDITFYTKQVVEDKGQSFGYKLKTALSQGWDILGALFFGIIGFWPIWIILTALFFVVKAFRKRTAKTE